MPVNVLTKNGYTGINIVSLWVAAQLKGFSSPVWATYKVGAWRSGSRRREIEPCDLQQGIRRRARSRRCG
ncbi:ArdC family protein [Bradyrhizobium sp. 76]|uniref:ArdC-like ssDNA-binding domain-containing protein n=1 Tax=Bradyrhizobium sp. 76 TaxID=2782680 RepID=UPI001FFAC45F|nr:ArdC family protein [Bradyrhizobium sp. 76]